MFKAYYLNFICLLLFLSCSSNISQKGKNNEGNKSLNVDSNINLKGNKEITLILLNDFNDSLKISLDNLIVGVGFFVTNESTASCKERIKLTIDTTKKSSLFFYNKKAISYKINLIGVKKFLYVWKQDNTWRHEFTDVIKELE